MASAPSATSSCSLYTEFHTVFGTVWPLSPIQVTNRGFFTWCEVVYVHCTAWNKRIVEERILLYDTSKYHRKIIPVICSFWSTFGQLCHHLLPPFLPSCYSLLGSPYKLICANFPLLQYKANSAHLQLWEDYCRHQPLNIDHPVGITIILRL